MWLEVSSDEGVGELDEDKLGQKRVLVSFSCCVIRHHMEKRFLLLTLSALIERCAQDNTGPANQLTEHSSRQG